VNKASNITQVQQLKNKRLCLPYGYSDKFVKGGVVDSLNLTINRVVDGAACIGHVQRGWSDAGLTNTYVSVNEITNSRLIDRELRIINADVEKVPLHFVISVSYPDAQTWMDNFNQAFYRITQNGVKAEIDNTFIQLIETL
jgi:polar amino acid transport system substrate-binding protein